MCEECGSDRIKLVYEDVYRCLACGAHFSPLDDEVEVFEKIRRSAKEEDEPLKKDENK